MDLRRNVVLTARHVETSVQGSMDSFRTANGDERGQKSPARSECLALPLPVLLTGLREFG